MAASFPNSIKNFRTIANRPGVTYNADDTKTLFKEDFDGVTQEIVAIENYLRKLPEGVLWNGKIDVSVSLYNLTLALKTLAGNDPSPEDPVSIVINGTFHLIKSALSVTVNSGDNFFNAGSDELATHEIDFFAYLGYNATDGVVIGLARISHAAQYGDFSTTTTNERYCAISTITNAASSDPYVVIGRFAATLGVAGTYYWSVPTFTPVNLIQRPIHETRWLDWTPAYHASGSMTWTSVSAAVATYKVVFDRSIINFSGYGTTGGTASVAIYFTLPFDFFVPDGAGGQGILCVDSSKQKSGVLRFLGGAPPNCEVYLYTGGNWTLGSSEGVNVSGLIYSI